MAGLLKRLKAKGKAARDADSTSTALDTLAPSPNPMTNLVLADIALRAGGALLKRGVETGILGQKHGTAKAKKIVKGRSLTQSLVGTALARIATRSVPGAIVVGGGMLAKTLYDRHHAKSAKAAGDAAVDAQAKKG